MNILRYFGLDVKRCRICDQNALPGHVCEQPMKWSRRGFLFMLAAAPVVASVATPDPLHLVSPLLELPRGVALARHISHESGLSIRLIRAYDPIDNKMISRLDALYGWGVIGERTEDIRQMCVDLSLNGEPKESDIDAGVAALVSAVHASA